MLNRSTIGTDRVQVPLARKERELIFESLTNDIVEEGESSVIEETVEKRFSLNKEKARESQKQIKVSIKFSKEKKETEN